MLQVSDRKKGTGFNNNNNLYHLKPKKENITMFAVGEKKYATTAAQAMTIIGYGDNEGHNLPVRSLDYCVKCEDYKDLASCIKIIDSYNDFDADRILKAAHWKLNLKHYLNENNPNNGRCLFDFWIAREHSPAFYVSWNERFNDKYIVDTEDNDKGITIYWQQYTAEDFKNNMQELSNSIGADEFSIEEKYAYEDGKKSYKARFWFD